MQLRPGTDDGRPVSRRIAVVGAGVAGLAAAWTLAREAPETDVVVLERASRAGGLVASERTPEGFLLEHGADCLLTTKPWGVDLVCATGLGKAIVTGSTPRRSYVARDGRLVPLPPLFASGLFETVRGLARTPLLTPRGKLRLAAEPLVGRPRGRGDETVGAFVGRRFGGAMLDAIVGPLVCGVYGGEAGRLSADACLPRLRALERRHGSVVVGMRRTLRARRRRAAREEVLPPMVSLREGMASLPRVLARALAGRLVLGVGVERIMRLSRGRFRLVTNGGDLVCDGVVLAVPAWQAPALVAGLDPDLAGALAEVPHQAIDCVSLAWRRREVPLPPTGTGFVTAPAGTRPTIACTWASEKWPGRAPGAFTLMRSVLSYPDARDRDLVALAREDLRELMGITAQPVLVRVRRIPRATPVYRIGALDRIAWMRARADALGAVALAGNAHGGIGIPDCVRSGALAARAVLSAGAERHVAKDGRGRPGSRGRG